MLPIRYIFMSPIPKIGEFGRARAAHARQSFHIQKFTGTLKMFFVGKNVQIPSFYLNVQLQKIEIKIL